MFTRFADLPVELALDIIEHFGWSSVLRTPHWLASTLRVNRTFHRTLLPILYRTIVITPHKFGTLSRLPASLRGNFDLTRTVLFSDALDYRAAMQLVGLFKNLRAVACDIPSYFALRHDSAFAPEMVVLTRPCEAQDVFRWLAPMFAGSTLCVVHPLLAPEALNLDDAELKDVRLRRLVLCHRDAALEGRLRAAIPTLERVLFVRDAGVAGDSKMTTGMDSAVVLRQWMLDRERERVV